MTELAARLEQAYPGFNKNWTIHLEPLRDSLFPKPKTPLLVLIAAVTMLLAVACANVANLLLARYSSRVQEIAVRAALGATRRRVVRQLLTESLLLGAAGGLLGVIFAQWAVSGLVALAPEDLSLSAGAIHVDFRMVAFAVALSMLTGILFGIAPAMVGSRFDLISALRGNRRFGSGQRLRSWLVSAEVAASVVLLAGATLLFRSLVGLETVNPGMDPSNLLTFRVSLLDARYEKAGSRTEFLERVLAQLGSLPPVRAASAAGCVPFTGGCYGSSVNIEGRPPAKPMPWADARSSAASLARAPTPGPRPLSPSIKTVAPDVFVMSISGRAFTTPALIRCAYTGRRTIPCESTPRSSALTRHAATSRACSAGTPSCSSTRQPNVRRSPWW